MTLGNLELGRLPVQKRGAGTIGNLQMVFQNPFDTLNPSHSVGAQIARVIRKFGVETDEAKVQERVMHLLDIVKLPRDFAKRRPRQLSGGQKQRIGIARAFAGNPAVVIADEPVSALDVSVQAAVTGLLMDIQRDNRTTLVFISHDLSVVRYLADRIVVMYLGQIMEQGTTDEIFAPPYHPYTEALLSAVPIADTRSPRRKVLLKGEIPSPSNPPPGCPFSDALPDMMPGLCNVVPPPIVEPSPGHRILCHLPLDTLMAMEPVITMGTERPAACPCTEGPGWACPRGPAWLCVTCCAPASPICSAASIRSCWREWAGRRAPSFAPRLARRAATARSAWCGNRRSSFVMKSPAVRSRTNRSFGVNLIPTGTDPRLLEDELAACFEARVHSITFFWDVRPDLVARAHEAGCLVLYQVGGIADAVAAAEAGADAIISQGVEAGGHVRGQTTSLVMLPQVAAAVDVPVVGAGGFASGASLVAALALGAEGILCGTAFLATKESFAHDYHKQRVVAASSEDTVHSDVFAINWPPRSPVPDDPQQRHRSLRGRPFGTWPGRLSA